MVSATGTNMPGFRPLYKTRKGKAAGHVFAGVFLRSRRQRRTLAWPSRFRNGRAPVSSRSNCEDKMSPHHDHGRSPDRGLAPAYRLAPNTPAEIAADLARLCAGSGQDVTATGNFEAVETGIPASTPATRAESITPDASAASGLAPKTAPESTAPASTSPSRRLALAGAVAMLVAPLAPRPAAARVAEADVELARLANEIDRTLDGAAYALDPVDDEENQNRRLRHADRLILRMVDVPAVGPAGVKAKAKGYLDSLSYDVLESAALAQSLAEDAERVCGEVSA